MDVYHPTLNTGISDIRIQDAILEYPIVRALIVPECDLEARRRCIALISNVIKAANPVLHFLLQFQKSTSDSKKDSTSGVDTNSNTSITSELINHYKLLSHFLSAVPPKEKLVRFWHKYYKLQLEAQIEYYGPHVLASIERDANTTQGDDDISPDASIRRMSLTSLYAQIRKARDILRDLADRVQGAVCIVFWESWDATYQQLAEIVGDSTMQAAENGRIFRPSGTAAIYINRRKVELRAQLHRQQRLMMQEKAAAEQVATHNQQGGGSLDIKLTPSFKQDKQSESPHVLLTPPETADPLIPRKENPSRNESVAAETLRNKNASKEVCDRVEDEEIQALIVMYEKKQEKVSAPGASATNVKDEFGSQAWPFKLLEAPVPSGDSGPLRLIDSSELDGVMDSMDVVPAKMNSNSKDVRNLKRKGLVSTTSSTNSTAKTYPDATKSDVPHSELRKRIRLMEEEEQAITSRTRKGSTSLQSIRRGDGREPPVMMYGTDMDQMGASGKSTFNSAASSIVW